MVDILSPALGPCLTAHDHSNELFVVNVALRIFLILQELLHLIIGQLLAQRCKQMSQLGDEMKPLASLSKWRSPSIKSSAVSAVRCLEMAW